MIDKPRTLTVNEEDDGTESISFDHGHPAGVDWPPISTMNDADLLKFRGWIEEFATAGFALGPIALELVDVVIRLREEAK